MAPPRRRLTDADFDDAPAPAAKVRLTDADFEPTPNTTVVPDSAIAPTLEAAEHAQRTHRPGDTPDEPFVPDPDSVMNRRSADKQAGPWETVGRELWSTIPGAALLQDENELQYAQKENPGTHAFMAAPKVLATVAPYLLTGGLTGGARVVASALIGGAQGATQGARHGGAEGAAWGGAEGALTAGLLTKLAGAKALATDPTRAQIMAWAANRAPAVAAIGSGGYQAYRGLRDGDAGDVVGGFTTAALPFAGWAASRPSKMSQGFTENALRAGAEMERPDDIVDQGVRAAGKEMVAAKTGFEKDLSADARVDAQNSAALRTATDDTTQRTYATAKEAADAAALKARRDLANTKDSRATTLDTDRKTYATAAEAAAEAKRQAQLGIQNDADSLHASDDIMQRTHDTAKEAKSLRRRGENDAHQLAGIAHQREMMRLGDEHEAAIAKWEADTDAAKTQTDRVRADLDRGDALDAIARKSRANYDKEIERLIELAQGAGMTKEAAIASAEGRYAQLHGTLGSRERDIYEMANQGHIDSVNPAHAPRARFAAESLNNLPTDETRFADSMIERIGRLGSKEAAHDEWVAEEAAARQAKATKGDPAAIKALAEANPPTADDAEMALAEKERASRVLEPAARARAEKTLRAAGIDPATLTDEQIINRDFGQPTSPKPLAPDDSDHRKAVLDFREKRIGTNEPLPPKPDRLATREAIRDARVELRNAPQAPLPPEPDAAAVRAANRSDTAALRNAPAPVLPPKPDRLATKSANSADQWDLRNNKPKADFDVTKAAPTRADVLAGLRETAKAGVEEDLNGRSLVWQHAKEKLNPIKAIGRLVHGADTLTGEQKTGILDYLNRHGSSASKGIKPGYDDAAEAEYVNEQLAKAYDIKRLPTPETARVANAGGAAGALTSASPSAIAALLEDQERKRKDRR